MSNDSTVEVSTTEFFTKLGVSDAGALSSLCALLGEVADENALKNVEELVRYGCFRDAQALRNALVHFLDGKISEDEGAPGVDALVALRRFSNVPTATTIRIYCRDLNDSHAQMLIVTFGEVIPAWFFPAIGVLARENPDPIRFMQAVESALAAWGWGDGTPDCNTLARVFMQYQWSLKMIPPPVWRIYFL